MAARGGRTCATPHGRCSSPTPPLRHVHICGEGANVWTTSVMAAQGGWALALPPGRCSFLYYPPSPGVFQCGKGVFGPKMSWQRGGCGPRAASWEIYFPTPLNPFMSRGRACLDSKCRGGTQQRLMGNVVSQLPKSLSFLRERGHVWTSSAMEALGGGCAMSPGKCSFTPTPEKNPLCSSREVGDVSVTTVIAVQPGSCLTRPHGKCGPHAWTTTNMAELPAHGLMGFVVFPRPL